MIRNRLHDRSRRFFLFEYFFFETQFNVTTLDENLLQPWHELSLVLLKQTISKNLRINLIYKSSRQSIGWSIVLWYRLVGCCCLLLTRLINQFQIRPLTVTLPSLMSWLRARTANPQTSSDHRTLIQLWCLVVEAVEWLQFAILSSVPIPWSDWWCCQQCRCSSCFEQNTSKACPSLLVTKCRWVRDFKLIQRSSSWIFETYLIETSSLVTGLFKATWVFGGVLMNLWITYSIKSDQSCKSNINQ